jgi:hypothetical protein
MPAVHAAVHETTVGLEKSGHITHNDLYLLFYVLIYFMVYIISYLSNSSS